MWPFTKKPKPVEPPPKDGMGFDLVPNPNGGGMKVSEEGEAAFKAWAKANPPPDDGFAYMATAIDACWRRCGISDIEKVKKGTDQTWRSTSYASFSMTPNPSQPSSTKSYDHD